MEEVTARTERTRLAAPNETARAFDVTVTRETDTIRGVLSITGVDGTVSKREVTGDSCGEVVSALALITALAIDPLAATRPGAPPDVSPPSTDGGAAPSAPAVPQALVPAAPSSATEPARSAPSLPGAAEPLQAAALSPAPSRPADRMRWSIGVQSQWLAGLVPSMAFGGGVFVGAMGKPHGYLVPSFRASVLAATTLADFTPTVGAELDWFVGRFEACPIRFPWERQWALSLCAALDAGVLRSQGTGLRSNVPGAQPWLASAALARLSWFLPGSLFVEVGGGVTAQATRYSFYFTQSGLAEAPVQRIPLFAATLNMGAGYRFP